MHECKDLGAKTYLLPPPLTFFGEADHGFHCFIFVDKSYCHAATARPTTNFAIQCAACKALVTFEKRRNRRFNNVCHLCIGSEVSNDKN